MAEIADDASKLRFLYGLKETCDGNAMACKWICGITQLRARDVLQILVGDDAESLNQNGPAESSIIAIMIPIHTQIAESRLAGRFWFRALYLLTRTRKDATYHEQI